MARVEGVTRFTEVVLRPRVTIAPGRTREGARPARPGSPDVLFANSVNFEVRNEPESSWRVDPRSSSRHAAALRGPAGLLELIAQIVRLSGDVGIVGALRSVSAASASICICFGWMGSFLRMDP